jgi:hypothetical protein
MFLQEVRFLTPEKIAWVTNGVGRQRVGPLGVTKKVNNFIIPQRHREHNDN